ncbi:MAG TPA: diguanylate cyclase [Solirubrobacteraceae bacterium]
MPAASFGAGRPRAVADVPPPALADGEAAAKGWLLRLMAARPLQDAPAVPTAELARDGPILCAAILRAVGSEAHVPRLEAGGDLVAMASRAGALAGAGSPASAVAAVGELRAAVWEALTTAMAPLDAATTAALAERLAFVCDLVAVATVSGSARAGEPADIRVHDARGGGDVRAAGERQGPGDVRAAAAGGDWRAAAQHQLAAGRGFALLAVEVDDAARLLAADRDGTARSALARAEDAVRAELRPGDVMAREEDGRLWIVAAELGATGGRALAERLADAVAAAATLRGAPLSASIGLAASPADGTDPAELEARADEALFAARAAGVSIA